MKKIITIILALVAIVSTPLVVRAAAQVTFSHDLDVTLQNGGSVTILQGSTAEKVILQNDSSIELHFASTTDFTIRYNNSGYDIAVNVFQGDPNDVVVTKTCSTTSNEFRVQATGSGRLIMTFGPGIACPAPPPPPPCTNCGGGGGGGGGSRNYDKPYNVKVEINGGAASTNDRHVRLDITGGNMTNNMAPLQMAISNSQNFSHVFWQTYKDQVNDWILEAGSGPKTVYVKLRNKDGVSPIANDSINLSGVLGTKLFNLIKTATHPAVYHLDNTNTRHLFPNEATFWSWHEGTWADQDITVVPQSVFDTYKVGENLTVQPGTNLIKFTNSSKIYKVTTQTVNDGRPILSYMSASQARNSYGAYWYYKVVQIESGFEDDYVKSAQPKPFDGSIYNLSKFNLVKGPNHPGVYHLDNRGVRYLFPNSDTYWSWHTKTPWEDQPIQNITQTQFDSYEAGRNITVKSGLIQFDNSHLLFELTGQKDSNYKPMIQKITSSQALAKYGYNWQNKVATIQNSFEENYTRTN